MIPLPLVIVVRYTVVGTMFTSIYLFYSMAMYSGGPRKGPTGAGPTQSVFISLLV